MKLDCKKAFVDTVDLATMLLNKFGRTCLGFQWENSFDRYLQRNIFVCID